MDERYAILIEWDGSGLYTATHPELLGCRGQGATQEEAMRDLEEARELHLKALVDAGVEPPQPIVLRGGYTEVFP